MISTQVKVELIHRLVDAGIQHIEAASFVSPKWVPQMANSKEVMEEINQKKGVRYAALVPNLTGLNRAINANATEVAVFSAASESFTQKNINCSIAESLNRFLPLIEAAKKRNIPVRGYVSTVMGCPYEGEISPEQVASVSREMLDMGCYEISLGDTIGIGTPLKAKKMLEAVAGKVAINQLAAHFHDTYGQALANLYAVLEEGISVIDTSVSGLGGCPYAHGASGNVATEDVLYMLNGLDIHTDIDLDKLVQTSHWISQQIGRPSASKVAQAMQL
jgi:hydroxymethylglutaryl-CoA lyase